MTGQRKGIRWVLTAIRETGVLRLTLSSTFGMGLLFHAHGQYPPFARGVEIELPALSDRFHDLDGDGDPDLISTRHISDVGSRLVIHARTGDSWELRSQLEAPSGIPADMNGDGISDIVAIPVSIPRAIGWYELTADLTTAEFHAIESVRQYYLNLAAGDFDGDGLLDIADGYNGDWYGRSGDQWEAHSLPTRWSGNLLTGDIDADGDLDLILQREGPLATRELDWFENLDDDPIGFLWHHIASRPFTPYSIDPRLTLRVADLNRDGAAEIVWNARDHWEWADKTGPEPTDWTVFRGPGRQHEIVDIEVADLDGDGNVDVVTASRVDGKVSWFENLGGEVPEFLEWGLTSDEINIFPGSAVAVVDIDADGDIDIIGYGGGRALLFENLGN